MFRKRSNFSPWFTSKIPKMKWPNKFSDKNEQHFALFYTQSARLRWPQILTEKWAAFHPVLQRHGTGFPPFFSCEKRAAFHPALHAITPNYLTEKWAACRLFDSENCKVRCPTNSYLKMVRISPCFTSKIAKVRRPQNILRRMGSISPCFTSRTATKETVLGENGPHLTLFDIEVCKGDPPKNCQKNRQHFVLLYFDYCKGDLNNSEHGQHFALLYTHTEWGRILGEEFFGNNSRFVCKTGRNVAHFSQDCWGPDVKNYLRPFDVNILGGILLGEEFENHFWVNHFWFV